MGFGKLILDRIGMRQRYQGVFERFIKLGASGLGYGVPTNPKLSEELEEVAFARSLERSRSERFVAFDVGANKGMYISMLQRCARGRAMDIHAFEPDGDLVGQLQRTFSASKDLRIVPKGVSDRMGTAIFHKHAHTVLSSFHVAETHPASYRDKTVSEAVEVHLITIDDYCAEHGITFIDHLKIDTEGHDLFVLKGAQRMLRERRIGALQFEFSEMNLLSRTTFFDHWNLLQADYDVHRLCTDGLYRIERYDPLLHELYHVVNFYASLKDRS